MCITAHQGTMSKRMSKQAKIIKLLESQQEYNTERLKCEQTGQLLVYTDGSCHNNGKKDAYGGYGVFFGDNDPRNVSEPLPSNMVKQTNNTAELNAILKVFQLIPETQKIIIRPDSTYARDVITNWMLGWKARGWMKQDGKVPANLDVIKQIERLWTPLREANTTFKWVEGHSGNYGNKRADELANQGSAKRLLEMKHQILSSGGGGSGGSGSGGGSKNSKSSGGSSNSGPHITENINQTDTIKKRKLTIDDGSYEHNQDEKTNGGECESKPAKRLKIHLEEEDIIPDMHSPKENTNNSGKKAIHATVVTVDSEDEHLFLLRHENILHPLTDGPLDIILQTNVCMAGKPHGFSYDVYQRYPYANPFANFKSSRPIPGSILPMMKNVQVWDRLANTSLHTSTINYASASSEADRTPMRAAQGSQIYPLSASSEADRTLLRSAQDQQMNPLTAMSEEVLGAHGPRMTSTTTTTAKATATRTITNTTTTTTLSAPATSTIASEINGVETKSPIVISMFTQLDYGKSGLSKRVEKEWKDKDTQENRYEWFKKCINDVLSWIQSNHSKISEMTRHQIVKIGIMYKIGCGTNNDGTWTEYKKILDQFQQRLPRKYQLVLYTGSYGYLS
jgi:ribonuclease HI